MRLVFSAVIALMLAITAVAQSAPAASTAPAAPAASSQPEAQLPCLIVKHRSFSDRLGSGFTITSGRYDLVDAQAVSGTKMSYKAKDLELLQSANVKVVVLQKTYSVEELKGARESCRH
jgi:hypothetical protein